jgi:hypothetical protein
MKGSHSAVRCGTEGGDRHIHSSIGKVFPLWRLSFMPLGWSASLHQLGELGFFLVVPLIRWIEGGV